MSWSEVTVFKWPSFVLHYIHKQKLMYTTRIWTQNWKYKVFYFIMCLRATSLSLRYLLYLKWEAPLQHLIMEKYCFIRFMPKWVWTLWSNFPCNVFLDIPGLSLGCNSCLCPISTWLFVTLTVLSYLHIAHCSEWKGKHRVRYLSKTVKKKIILKSQTRTIVSSNLWAADNFIRFLTLSRIELSLKPKRVIFRGHCLLLRISFCIICYCKTCMVSDTQHICSKLCDVHNVKFNPVWN